jgi:hypothetical protein
VEIIIVGGTNIIPSTTEAPRSHESPRDKQPETSNIKPMQDDKSRNGCSHSHDKGFIVKDRTSIVTKPYSPMQFTPVNSEELFIIDAFSSQANKPPQNKNGTIRKNNAATAANAT